MRIYRPLLIASLALPAALAHADAFELAPASVLSQGQAVITANISQWETNQRFTNAAGFTGNFKSTVVGEEVGLHLGLGNESDLVVDQPYFSSNQQEVNFDAGAHYKSDLPQKHDPSLAVRHGFTARENPFKIMAALGVSPSNTGKSVSYYGPSLAAQYQINDAILVSFSGSATYADHENLSKVYSYEPALQIVFNPTISLVLSDTFRTITKTATFGSVDASEQQIVLRYRLGDYRYLQCGAQQFLGGGVDAYGVRFKDYSNSTGYFVGTIYRL
jgi:hypothetical protein